MVRWTIQTRSLPGWPLPKFCLVPEGADEAGAFTTDAAEGMGGPAGELPEITGAQVGQLVLLPVTPKVLDRV